MATMPALRCRHIAGHGLCLLRVPTRTGTVDKKGLNDGLADVHFDRLGPIVLAYQHPGRTYIPGRTDKPNNRPIRTPWVGSAKVPRWDDPATSFRHHGCEGVCPGSDLPRRRPSSRNTGHGDPHIEFKREPE